MNTSPLVVVKLNSAAARLGPQEGHAPPAGACAGIPVEKIYRLVGDSGTTVAELVYRHQLRPVIQTGATAMDRLFPPGGQSG